MGSDAPIDASNNEKEELKNVLHLLKLKNEKPDELSRDKKFLTAAFSFLEQHSDCIWCQYPQLCGELLRIFSFVESPPLKWFRERTITCLTSCRACIESYYGIRPKIFTTFRKIYDEATVKDFEGKIHAFDVNRLKEPFKIYLNDKESRKKLPIKFILFEILLFPGWIVSPEISSLFETVLEQIISSMKMVKISEKLPGVIVCSVHPNQTIRSWAKSVINSDIQSDINAVEYARINYSWDTVTFLSRKLDDESYSDAIYVCLKASKFDFINSCANWDWTNRIFTLLKKDNSKGFMEALRLYSLLIKTLSNEQQQFSWHKIPELFSAISSILDNPSFALGSHAEQDSANFVLEWIPQTVSACLTERKFKVAHKIVSELMEFILESRAPFQWKVKVVEKFTEPLSSRIENAYLLSKLCQLLLFLFDKRFSEFRKAEHEALITASIEKVFVALVKYDLISEIGETGFVHMEGTPISAVFDASNYRKYLVALENRPLSINFLNSIGKELGSFVLNSETSNDTKIWIKRIELLSFIVKETIGNQGIRHFSEQLISLLIFVYLSGFKLILIQMTNQTDSLSKIIEIHPEKSLKSTNRILSNFLKQKFKMRDGSTIPLEKTMYLLNSVIGKVFMKDIEILKIYPERFELVLEYFLKVLFVFYKELNYFVSLPGGTIYYELSSAISSFGVTLISLIGVNSFQNCCTKLFKPPQIANLMVPCLANMIMGIFQRSNQSKYTDIPYLVNLSSELIILSGNLKVDLEEVRLDQILKVLLTSNAPNNFKISITKALNEYTRLTGKSISIPTEPPKNINFVSTSPANFKSLDPGLVKKLEALERMDDELINKHNNNNGHSSSSLKPSSSSKLGQLRQELAKEGINSSVPAKKSRFTPIVVQKAPRMMTQADLLRSRDDSSESDPDIEITSDTFKNAPQKVPSSHPFTAHPHRSIKLIDINDDENGPTGQHGTGQPISSKATAAAQMQRDWQSAQRLHRYILSLDYSTLSDSEIIDLPVQSIPDSFPNYEKYLQVFEPLLQLECRSQLISAKEEGEGRLTYFKGIIQTISMVDDFHEVVFNFGDDAVHRLFTEQDLLVGHPFVHHHAPKSSNDNNSKSQVGSEVLGLVINTASRQKGFEVTMRFYLKGRATDVDLQLLTRLKQAWKFAKLCNLVTNNREFLALQNLPLYSSCARILQPKFIKIDSNIRSQIDRAADFYTRSLGLNLPQASAIAYSLMNPNFFTLIQGPPGTGKTRTIEGFLAVLFGRPSSEFRIPLQYKRILICAPSNAAIDEIVRRLKGGVKDSYGKSISLRIVRVGSLEMIHEDVKDLSIDGIVENMIQGHISSALEMLQNNRKQLAELKVLLDKSQAGEMDDDNDEDLEDKEEKAFYASTKPMSSNNSNNSTNLSGKSVQELKNQYWQVKENIRKGTKFIEDSRQNLRLKVLNEAQVVCCTLSASGHEVISRIDGDFEMVIIDEACQAIELSALIPLQYGCKRAVLVGDPNQLPPTVISQTAVTFAYEQSLFQRLQKIDPSAVQLLSLQYRMHPDISSFPSSYFYGGRLANGPNVRQENTRPWHGAANGLLGPFRFFDVPGQEQLRTFSSGKQGNSMMNELEAKITASLIALLSNSSPNYKLNGKIGIITPYKEQRRLISRELVNRFGPNILQSVEVSTVDGYQGQEKEIIIFSCVRTGEKSSGGIGFLNDSRRLNVAITRAKCSLFLLGKSSTLLQNPLWRSLIEDAKDRKMFVPFESTFWQEQKKLTLQRNLINE